MVNFECAQCCAKRVDAKRFQISFEGQTQVFSAYPDIYQRLRGYLISL